MRLDLSVVKFKYVFGLLLIVKVGLAATFSSGYKDQLFVPFIRYFINHFDNPWTHYFEGGLNLDAFPYHALMLGVFSVFSWLPGFIEPSSPLANLWFKIPIILADLGILFTLIQLFPGHKNASLLFYFANPIVVYSSYMHSQLDLVPTAVIFYATLLVVKNKPLQAGFIAGAAVLFKAHTILMVPLLALYFLQQKQPVRSTKFLATAAVTILCGVLPLAGGKGFQAMVLFNSKQRLLFDSSYQIGDHLVYLPVLALALIYSRFAFYSKVNNELLFSYGSLLYSSLLLLIKPEPAWYLWPIPFLSVFFIKRYSRSPKLAAPYLALVCVYTVYFLFFHHYEYQGLLFLGHALQTEWSNPIWGHLGFTALTSTLAGSLYLFYGDAIRSNAVYLRKHNTLIGVGGDSGAGKSTLLDDLNGLFGKKLLALEGDAEHKWARGHQNWSKFTHLDPKANFIHQQAEHLISLKRGSPIFRREYEHDSGEFSEPRKVSPRDYVVISGLHPFYLPKMRKVIDVKIYLDTDESLRRYWKILRDTSHRGYTREKVVRQLELRSEDTRKYIKPQREFADFVIHYFSENLDQLREGQEPQLQLYLEMGANLSLEPLIGAFKEQQIKHEWDYLPNLHSQYIRLPQPPHDLDVSKLATLLVPNHEELLSEEPEWESGYRGLTQLLTLVIVSQNLQDAHEI